MERGAVQSPAAWRSKCQRGVLEKHATHTAVTEPPTSVAEMVDFCSRQ